MQRQKKFKKSVILLTIKWITTERHQRDNCNPNEKKDGKHKEYWEILTPTMNFPTSYCLKYSNNTTSTLFCLNYLSYFLQTGDVGDLLTSDSCLPFSSFSGQFKGKSLLLWWRDLTINSHYPSLTFLLMSVLRIWQYIRTLSPACLQNVQIL